MPRKVLLALVLLYLVVQGLPFLEGFRTTPDDVAYHAITMGGERHFWAFVHHAAQSQGRIVHYLDVPVTLLAAYFAEDTGFRIFYTAFHFLTLALFAHFVALLSRRSIGVLMLIVLVSFQPLDYFHLPPNAYPFHVSLPVFLILCSRIGLLRQRRQGMPDSWRSLPWQLPAFVGVMFGEGAFLFFAAVVVMELLVEQHPVAAAAPDRGMRGSLAAMARTYGAEVLVGLLFLVLYLSYRTLHPSTYAGNQLPASLDLGAFGKTLAGHVYGGTSLAALVRNATRLVEVLPTLGPWVWGCASFILVGVTALWWRQGGQPRPVDPRAVRWSWLLLAALAGAVLVTAPVALVSRFQRWCSSIHSCVFHDSRLSYYFTGLALVIVLVVLSDGLRRRGRAGTVARAGLALALGAMAALTYLNNVERSLDMRDYAAGWRRARVVACLGTDDLSASELAALIDPRRRLTMHPTYDRDIYWPQYLRHLRASGLSCDDASSPTELFPPMPTGVRMATHLTGPGKAYLGDGWSRPEADHVWSQAGEVRLWLPADPAQRSLRLEVSGFLSPAHPRQRVQVRVGRREVMAVVIEKPGLHLIDVPLDGGSGADGATGKDRPVLVSLVLPDAVSPEELGMGGDRRRLGLSLIGLTMH